MKCPHCLVEFHDESKQISLGNDAQGNWDILSKNCPNCKNNIYYLRNFILTESQFGQKRNYKSELLIRPKIANRPPVPLEVPVQFADDYNEACLVIVDSPKASAALSRRCLQHLIRENLGIKKKDLFQEIQEIIDNGLLPTDLIESIDSIRNVGNFAAHPIKSQSSGEIVEVEPHEAEWNLDVIEMLFEYLFVRPQAIKKKRDALNLKLSDAGKNPMQ
ncbi:DUF4145 domain-containing protein [Flavobacterium sp. KS-LB2]|uniref:DUF4145 domain-containing protein n=1 Tax=Flavobacterium sp. KS-LB2 TaxID=3120525 RepID=UPI0030D255A7